MNDRNEIYTHPSHEDEKGNAVYGEPTVKGYYELVMTASNCKVIFDENVTVQDLRIFMEADGGVVKIGKESLVNGRIRTGLNSNVIIGEALKPTGAMNISASEKTTVSIGDGCMLAAGVDIRSDDSHPIFSRSTGKRLNPSRSVSIGDHVWLGPQVAVLAGAQIGAGSVIGYRSIVKGEIPMNCVAVGIPAKVIKSDIIWDSKHLSIDLPWNFETIEDIQ